MLARKAAVVVACFSSALVANTAAAQVGCWYPNEAKAAQMMQLNTKMMVGALHCREKTSQIIDDYNTFVTGHRDMLEAHHTILQNRFDREGSTRKGSLNYGDFVTTAANQHSADPSARDAADCATIVALVRMASTMSESDLLMLAQSMTKAPASGPCRSSRYSFDEEPGATGPARDNEIAQALAERQPWEPLAPVAARKDPVPTMYTNEGPPAGLPTGASALAEERAAVAQVAPEAVTQTPASAPATDGAVLQAAVAALQAATAALQMAMQTQPGT